MGWEEVILGLIQWLCWIGLYLGKNKLDELLYWWLIEPQAEFPFRTGLKNWIVKTQFQQASLLSPSNFSNFCQSDVSEDCWSSVPGARNIAY